MKQKKYFILILCIILSHIIAASLVLGVITDPLSIGIIDLFQDCLHSGIL